MASLPIKNTPCNYLVLTCQEQCTVDLFIFSWPIEVFKVLLLYRCEIQQGLLKEICRVYLKNMFVILLGYPIDLLLFCQWLQTEPSLGVPHYQPRNVSVAANAPRMRVVSLLWPALGRAPTPAGSPVEAAACLTGGMESRPVSSLGAGHWLPQVNVCISIPVCQH